MRRVYDAFFRDGLRSTLRWIVIYLTLLGLAVAYGFVLIDHRRVEGCHNRNEATADAVHVLAKELVKQASPNTSTDRINGFLRGLDEALEETEVKC